MVNKRAKQAKMQPRNFFFYRNMDIGMGWVCRLPCLVISRGQRSQKPKGCCTVNDDVVRLVAAPRAAGALRGTPLYLIGRPGFSGPIPALNGH